MPTVSPALISLGHELLPWVLASTACYALATILLAMVWRHASPRNRLFALAHSRGGTATGWLVWMIWLLGPGYVALIMGLLSPRLMGLSQIDLGTGLGLGALFAALSVGVLLAAGLTYRRTRHTGSPYASLGQAVGASVRLVLEAGALQWHWAFYRSAFIVAGQNLRAVGAEGHGPHQAAMSQLSQWTRHQCYAAAQGMVSFHCLFMEQRFHCQENLSCVVARRRIPLLCRLGDQEER